VLTDLLELCGQILALHLSVLSVFFLQGFPCSSDLQVAQCPDLPSYCEKRQSLVFSVFKNHMAFIQHVANSVLKFIESFLCRFAYFAFKLRASDVLHREVTVEELLSHGSIWLEITDFGFEYPMP
ncbi:UD15 glucuronosyltransferase, partial [Vidua chalybeata]|nr:UD15 glucuronosyltransferase [Vidua chalybeata]